MKVVDSNVLLYAINPTSPHHDASRRWLDSSLSGSEPVGFTWVVIVSFLRIATNRRFVERPLTIDQATATARGWLARPNAVVVDPPGGHINRIHALLEPIGTAGNLVNDAHIAAIALHHRAEVVTFDNDFDRFDGVRRLTPT